MDACVAVQTCAPTQKDGADFLDFTPSRVHLLLQGIYGDHPKQNDGLNLYGLFVDDAVWQCNW